MKKLASPFVTIAFVSTAAYAAPTPPFVTAEEISALTLVLTPKAHINAPYLTEARLRDVGCTFHITKPVHIAEVRKLMKFKYGTDIAPVRLRHAIYLSMSNQPEPAATYLIAEDQRDRDATIGSVTATANERTMYFVTRPEMPEELRAWVRSHIAEISFTPPKSDPTNPCTFAR